MNSLLFQTNMLLRRTGPWGPNTVQSQMPHNLKFVRYKVHHEDRRYTKKERKHHVRVCKHCADKNKRERRSKEMQTGITPCWHRLLLKTPWDMWSHLSFLKPIIKFGHEGNAWSYATSVGAVAASSNDGFLGPLINAAPPAAAKAKLNKRIAQGLLQRMKNGTAEGVVPMFCPCPCSESTRLTWNAQALPPFQLFHRKTSPPLARPATTLWWRRTKTKSTL